MLVLAESPMMGRPCGSVRRGYRRMEHDHHVIFYSIGQKSVLTNAFFMNGGCRACKCPVIGNLIR